MARAKGHRKFRLVVAFASILAKLKNGMLSNRFQWRRARKRKRCRNPSKKKNGMTTAPRGAVICQFAVSCPLELFDHTEHEL
uniref:Uncharacterized protein n=1 Tax=Hyaloperonospora arabidopsidis (strain Emoy2) TaxID=559515 RepID=M4C0G7_HYAAE